VAQKGRICPSIGAQNRFGGMTVWNNLYLGEEREGRMAVKSPGLRLAGQFLRKGWWQYPTWRRR
jgi:hypothetical protein